jgi:AbrB family looped-hinge helix DNA binding protein
MTHVVTVSTKRQFTIPVALFTQLNLATGDSLLVEEKEGALYLKKAVSQVRALAGSVTVAKSCRE